MAKVYRFLKVQSHYCLVQSYENVLIVKMRFVQYALMTEVRDNTLKILENNSLADIAF
jgi:hypothetical protein